MSKKSEKQSKVFISFGDVAGGFKPVSAAAGLPPTASTPLPLYGGNDSELAILSKKLMKKDGVTKIKAIQDLVGVLNTKPEATLAEFLVFYVYAFSKLYLEDHRVIREKLCTILLTVVSVERRLLAPHMTTLIGPWWLLTGDPVGDVAATSYEAFCGAIPPKKRQLVLVYLSGSILGEAIKNLNLRPDMLCDLSLTPLDEAEERLERVMVSTLASIEKLVMTLSAEQNLQLTRGTADVAVESFGETVVTYKDLFTQGMWVKCLDSKFVLVRRAAYQLITTLALRAPEVLTTSDIAHKSSIAFFKLFLNCLLIETNALNLHVLLNAFVTTTTTIPAFFEIASVNEDIVPVLLHLLQTNAPMALEYVLPISGSLPAGQVSLLEPASADPTAALKQGQSQQGMCGFLQQLFDFAEQKAAEGGVQDLRAEHGHRKIKSGRRHAAEKLNVHKVLQQQSLRAECVVLGMQTDVCAVELATLLLLRRSASFSSSTSSLGDNQVSENVQAVVSQLVQSIIITVQSATIALRGETTKRNLFQKAVEASVSDVTISPGSAQVKETARAALAAIGRSLLQLHRAALMEMHITSAQWTQLLWDPLSEGLLDLYLVTTASPAEEEEDKVVENEGEGEGDQMAMMLSVSSLLNCILQTVSSAWSEGVSPAMATFQGGASAIALKFVNFATAELRAGRSGMAAASNSVLLSQLVMTLSDPSVGLAGSVVPLPEVLKLLSAEWVDVLIGAIASGPVSSSVHTNYVLSAGLFDIVAFIVELGGAGAARVVLSRCVKSNSIEAVCIVCKAAGASTLAWGTDALDWAQSTGLKFLQSESSCVSNAEMKLQVRFLLLICAQPTCAPVCAAWFAAVKAIWLTPRSNKLADWFILSLVAVALKQSQNQRSVGSNRLLLPPDLHAAVTNWLSDHRDVLPDSLQKLFFGRLRNNVHVAKVPAHHEVLILKDVNVVMSWGDAQKLLLPILTPQLRLGFYGAVAATLNSALKVSTTPGDEGREDASGEAEEVSTNLRPKKWSLHVCGLLSAQQSTSALEGVKLFTSSFWEDTLKLCLSEWSGVIAGTGHVGVGQKAMSFALDSLSHILSGDATSEDGEIGSQLIHSHMSSHPALVFYVLLGIKQSLRVVPQSEKAVLVATEQQLLALFAATSVDLRAPFFTERLASIRDAPSAEDNVRALEVVVMKSLLAKEFHAKSFSREPLRLSSPGIRRDERPALGSPGQYLSWKALPASDPFQTHSVSSSICTDSAQLTRIAPIACKLAAVHREAGADPYFTIAMDQTGDVEVAHELQVEWPKVILGRNLPSSHVDLIWNYQTTPSLNVRARTARKFESATLEACVAWLESSLDIIVQEVVACSSSGCDAVHVLFRHCSLYADVFVAACDHLLDQPASVRERFEVRMVAHLRGVASHLLSPCCTLPMYAARCTGLLLVQALLRADLGTGSGLWLPVVLNNVRIVATSVVAASLPLDAMQHANLLALTVATLAHILGVVSHSEVCLDCAETILSTALAALPSPSTELASNLLLLLAAVWRHRSDTRDVKAEVPVLGDLSTWETEGFDFSVFVLVEGLSGISVEARVEACRAAHFCLLKRSRRSCRELMGPSLVSRFAEQLQGIAVCDPVTGSSPLSALVISDPTVLNTLRVTSCKILDAFEASKSDTNNTAGSSSSSAKAEEALAIDDISLHEQERIDLEKDGAFLSELIGSVYSSELTRRLAITEYSIGRIVSTESLAAEGGDEDGSAEGACSTPVASSVTSGSSVGRKMSKRTTLDHLCKNDPLGTVLLWLLLLQGIDARAVEGWSVRARCVNYLKNSGMSSNVLHLLIRLGGDLLKFKDVSALLQRVETVGSVEVEEEAPENRSRKNNDQANQNNTGNIPIGSLQHLAVYALFRTVCTLPAMFRTFYNDDCTRVLKTRLSKFVEDRVRESLMKREVSLIAASSAAGRWNASEFSVRGSVVSGEVTAVLSKDETSVEIKVKLPASYPLKIVEVSCTSRIGVSDGRWRRWVLQIIQLLGMQDGSVVDAVLLWKCNIEKELEGVEPCPICYCTLHTKTLCLPSMACPTCNNKFHSQCLSTWFKSSGKSKCVICQQPFFS